ncbi:MAG: histidine phosphatase family protein [Lewinellaceae bacterium]|nr:histidine phosphatase family protein [Lewinellaceae bacterium]
MQLVRAFNFLSSILVILTVLSCAQNQGPNIDEIQGKTVHSIVSEVIHMDDGTTFEIPQEGLKKIFYLTRHAEKDTVNKQDPILTSAGLDRSAKLADILRGTRIDAIYSTLFMRTMLTVDSLADTKLMKILPYDNKNIRTTIQEIKASDNINRVLMVGHSNTIPSIVNSISKQTIFQSNFEENDYSNFVVVALYNDDKSQVYKLKY